MSVVADQVLQTRSVPELVREEIIRLITTGELAAGEKLNELDFSRRFGISRAPIREAFRALEEAGLVKLERNRGVYVREVNESEARELYELRASLDEMAGRQLAVRLSEPELAELNDWVVRLGEAASNGEMARYFSLNIDFHDRMVQMTNNATLLEFYRVVIGRMYLMRRHNFSVIVGAESSHVEHREILDALKTHDPILAGVAMRDHVLKAYDRLTSLLRKPSKR